MADEFWKEQQKSFGKSVIKHLLIKDITKADLVEKIISLKIDGFSKNYLTLCQLGFMRDKGFDMFNKFASNGPEPMWDKEFLLKQDETVLKNLFMNFDSLMEREEVTQNN